MIPSAANWRIPSVDFASSPPFTMTEPAEPKPLSKNEGIKENSRYLRGSLAEDLLDTSTGAISDESAQLSKFHGIYMQDDRDQRSARRKAKLEKAFIFMVRVRVPGGVCTPKQWLAMDDIAERHANGQIKLTTRQAFQLHHIVKSNLKASIAEINASLLDTLAACGDVNRNVMCSVNPEQSEVHEQVLEFSRKASDHLSPRTSAYHEIWLDDVKVAGGEPDEEPIYGKTYLPRKFKMVVAVPPQNDVDIFAHDLGFIAIVEEGKLVGYNVTVGGGMGMSHNQPETFPRTADVMAFCTPEQALDVSEKVVLVQRDFGDRVERKHARLKYTIEDRGLAWFRGEVEARLGYALEDPRPFQFTTTGDTLGWTELPSGKSHLTLFIQNGRVYDNGAMQLRTALRKVAKVHDGDFRLTPNQNLLIGNISPEKRSQIEEILQQHGVGDTSSHTGLRLNSMACVALPTCGLALAESQRHLPKLLDELDVVIEECGLKHDAIVIRNTGCPNGCARPYLAEIGLVGRLPGKYNIYLGAAFDGSRLNKLWKESVKDSEITNELRPVIEHYAKERNDGEHFGDFCIRAGYVKATPAGNQFHS